LWGHYIFTKLTLFILSIPGFITSVITNSITSFISFFVTSLAGSFFALGDTFLYFVLPTAAFCLAIGVPQIINPISALFCLIGVFLAVIFILLSLQVEFLSMVFLIVYIGAIAILFLFVIMILHLEKIDPYYLMSTDWRYYRVFLVLPLFYFSAEIY
jgi:NADH:ubiquinone oxidoreductase subunit 6 (subunit J)